MASELRSALESIKGPNYAVAWAARRLDKATLAWDNERTLRLHAINVTRVGHGAYR